MNRRMDAGEPAVPDRSLPPLAGPFGDGSFGDGSFGDGSFGDGSLEDGSFDGEPFDDQPLEDEPSNAVARYLFPTERFRGEWRKHVISPIRGVLLTAVVTALIVWAAVVWIPAGYRPAAVVAVAVGGALAAVDLVVNWYVTRFVLTNKRILVVQGVLVRRVAMLPLVRVTDMRYVQSPVGQLLNYGTFVVVQSRWGNLMRRTRDLPNPNELYLRVVEEMYEPEAVEARVSRAVSHAVREAIQGPELVNYDGWVSVEVLDGAQPVPVSEDRRVVLTTGRRYTIVVTIASVPVAPLAELLAVTTGVDRPTVRFSVELDSDHPSLRKAPVELVVDQDDEGEARFTTTVDAGPDLTPWLWIRVSQASRTVQSVELLVEPARDRG